MSINTLLVSSSIQKYSFLFIINIIKKYLILFIIRYIHLVHLIINYIICDCHIISTMNIYIHYYMDSFGYYFQCTHYFLKYFIIFFIFRKIYTFQFFLIYYINIRYVPN